MQPTFRTLLNRQRFCLALCCGLTALLLGCGEDEPINSYKVPKEPIPPIAYTVKPGETEARTIGAIFPEGDTFWFFKVHAPKELVDGQRKEIDEFIRSVRLTGKPEEPLQWKLPQGWKEGKPSVEFIKNEFLFGPNDSLRLTVSTARGTLLSNVNRWREEVGLSAITDGQMKYTTEKLDVNGVPVTLVDVTGRLKKRPMGMPR